MWRERFPGLTRCLLYFGLLGPVFGFIVSWPMLTLQQNPQASASDLFGSIVLGGAFSVALWVFALLLGGPPAVVVGLVYWALQKRTKDIGLRLALGGLTMLLGACASALWTAVVFEEDLNALSSKSHWLTFGVPGSIAVLLCALVVEWRVLWTSRAS